jgi:hypothetical protein
MSVRGSDADEDSRYGAGTSRGCRSSVDTTTNY